MLIKKDHDYLNKTFASKKDLSDLEKRMEKKFVTKDEFANGIREVIEFVGEMHEKTLHEIKKFREEIGSLLENHEFRIKRLEKRSLAN